MTDNSDNKKMNPTFSFYPLEVMNIVMNEFGESLKKVSESNEWEFDFSPEESLTNPNYLQQALNNKSFRMWVDSTMSNPDILQAMIDSGRIVQKPKSQPLDTINEDSESADENQEDNNRSDKNEDDNQENNKKDNKKKR